MERRFYEYRGMRGGEHYERMEANPMIGYRGCFRNVAESDLFGIELAAITHVWESGLSNLHLMIYNTISEDGYSNMDGNQGETGRYDDGIMKGRLPADEGEECHQRGDPDQAVDQCEGLRVNGCG